MSAPQRQTSLLAAGSHLQPISRPYMRFCSPPALRVRAASSSGMSEGLETEPSPPWHSHDGGGGFGGSGGDSGSGGDGTSGSSGPDDEGNPHWALGLASACILAAAAVEFCTPAARAEPAAQADAATLEDGAAEGGQQRAPEGSSASPATSSSDAQAQPATPRRVAIFVEPSPFTYVCGYKTRFCNTIEELIAAGCEVLVVTPGKSISLPWMASTGEEQPKEFHGARVISALSFPCPGYATVPLSFGISPRIFNQVKAFNPDIIHCTSPGTLPAAGWLYSKLLRIPLVVSYHTHVPCYLPRLKLGFLVSGAWAVIRGIHRAADLTIVVSPPMREELVRAGAADRRSIRVWRKAVDTAAFNPAARSARARRELSGGHPEDPLLLYVGRISHEKNIESLKLMLERLPRARLALVGHGPAQAELEEEFKPLGSRVRFVGLLQGSQLSEAYASADVFVMPSESETLGNVVSEAMASGTPVVAVAAGGIPSIVTRPGRNGFLYPPGDVKAAVRQVQRLLGDASLRQRVAAEARREVEHWGWRAATLEILRHHYPAASAAHHAQELCPGLTRAL